MAILAQIINALLAAFDKSLVTEKKVLHPFSYAFYVSMLSALSFVVFFAGNIKLPFSIEIPKFSNLTTPSAYVIALCLLTGFAMFIALVNLYEALSKSDASDVVPVVSSVGAIVTLIFEFTLLGGRYSTINFFGIFLLIAGTFLVSNYRFSKDIFFHTVISGFAFASYYVLIKLIFNVTNFDSGFLYSRLGLVLAALIIILIPQYRKRIFRKLDGKRISKGRISVYVLILKAISGIASILTLKAIDLGSVAMVQALAGTQFLTLIIFSFFFGWLTPSYFGENNLKVSDYVTKVVAASIITIGLYFSFY